MRRQGPLVSALIGAVGALVGIGVAAAASTTPTALVSAGHQAPDDRGATAQEPPAVAATGPGKLEMVWLDGRPARLRTQRFGGGGWSAPTVLDSGRLVGRASGVAAAADLVTGELRFAIVADDQVWTRTAGGGGWSSVGGPAKGAPALTALGGGRFALVVRGRADDLRVRILVGGTWGAWRSLGGRFGTASPAAAATADGTVVVAAVDRVRGLVTGTVRDGVGATGWRPVGLSTTATPGLAVDPGDGAWHVVVRGPGLSGWERVSRTAGQSWEASTRLGGRLRSGVGVAAWGPDRLDLVAFDASGKLVRNAASAGRWSGFAPVAPLTVSPKTKVLSADAVTSVSGDPAGSQTLTLAGSTPAPKPGDVLVASSTPETPDGLLVKVVSARRNPDGSTTVTTRPAKLPDAVANGSFSVPITLSADDVASGGGEPVAPRKLTPRAAGAPLNQSIRKNVSCSASASATISGSVSITPTFRFDAAWSLFGGVESVSFTGEVTQDAELKASIDGQASCRLNETPLLAEPLRFKPIVFTVGVVPIVVTPELQLYLDASGNVQAALATSTSENVTLTVGLTWRDGNVRPHSQLRTSFGYAPPAFTGSARAEAAVAPKFSFLIYGVAGPRLDSRLWTRFDANPANRPAWTLKAGISAGGRLVVPPLDISVGASDIVRFEKIIAQGDVAAPPPPPPPPAATKTVTTSTDYASCGADNKWTFTMNGIGGNTGITPPASISARTTTGSTVTVPLARSGDNGYGDDQAVYEVVTASKLTGVATAVVDQRWNAESYFALGTGPCVKTAMTFTTSAATARVGNQIQLSGRLTRADGTPLAGRAVTIRWHSPSRDGKGQELGPFTTNADGRFSATVRVDEAGGHTFTGEFSESGPLERGELGSTAGRTVPVT